eukprot:scaffold3373_cov137-Cylindrotheca_fusiformis.AAC.3
MLNASDISSCIDEGSGILSNCIAATNAPFPLSDTLESASRCSESVEFACRTLDKVSDDSCADEIRNYMTCLVMRQFSGCDSIQCAADVAESQEDSFVEFAKSGLGKLLIAFLAVGLLILLDFSCEKRLLCIRSCFGDRKREALNKSQEQKKANQQLPTISEDRSPSTSEDENAHIQRIESLRSKRRDIENWLDHSKQNSPKQQRPPSATDRENGDELVDL